MKAVILVGGLGTRLRPLTCNMPKPMLPLANRTFIETMLLRLRDQGIEEVILAVQYLADRFVAELGDGSHLGIKLHIMAEPEPLGTAGAVKNVEHLLDSTTFVFNGDVLTDLDLQEMLAFHREHSSAVTISLTAVDDPTLYGLVEMDADKRIKRFLEKPRLDEITTNLINAGTYVIEPEVFRYVPPAQHFMFERGLFPVLLQTGDPMFGYPSRAYWSDIGTPQSYLEVNHDILIGKVKYDFRGQQMAANDRIWVEENVDIHKSVQLVGPVLVGPGVTIGRGARVIGPTVIGARCQIGRDVVIESAVLWDDNIIEAESTLRSCVLGRGNHVGERTIIAGGTVISDECQVGGENRLEKGMRVWPKTTIPDHAISF